MPTHAELSTRLLTEAAGFFRLLADQNEPIRKQMIENAIVFEQVCALMDKDPAGRVAEKTHADMAVKLLQDAGAFFKTLSRQNTAIEDQMQQNAEIYEQMAGLLEKDPGGSLG